jgi:hypothetical protein
VYPNCIKSAQIDVIFRFDNKKNSEENMLKSSVGAALALAALLTGCGGGGDCGSSSNVPGSSSTASTVLRAEGVYTGTLSNGEKHETIILENGQIFMMHGDLHSSNQALTEGPGKAENGSYSSTDIKDYRPFGAFISGQYVPSVVIPASISASYNVAGALTGTITEPTETITFAGSRPPTSSYDYDDAASLNKIAGAWGDLSLAVNVTSAGDIRLSSRACDGKGIIKPRASGKNVFDIEWTFISIPACPFYGQTINSVAFVRSISENSNPATQKLVIMATDAGRTNARTFYLTR